MREARDFRRGAASAPTSPELEGQPLFHRQAISLLDQGADSLLDMEVSGDPHEENEDDERLWDQKEEEDDEIVDALPMRQEGESVDDYITRATRMLEQQAFNEM